jgi:hypothetical protein
MTLILNTPESKWLSDFYSEPQGLNWKILTSDNASENVLARKVLPWLQKLEGPEDDFFTVIPSFGINGSIYWYGVATTTQLFSEMSDDLKSFIGTTYCTFEIIDDITISVHEQILKKRFGNNIVRFTPFGTSQQEQVESLLDAYLSLIKRRPANTERTIRPFGKIRNDFDLALLAKNEDHARQLINEMSLTGRLDSSQKKCLEIRLLAGLGYTDLIARDQALISSVIDLSLPHQIITDITSALYETYIRAYENENEEVVMHNFNQNIYKPYGGALFRTRKSIRDPIVLRSFLLAQLAHNEPDQSKIDGIVSAYSEGAEGRNLVLKWKEWLKPTSRVQPPATQPNKPAELVNDAIIDEEYLRAAEICLEHLAEDWVLTPLLRCAENISSKELSQRVVSHVASLKDLSKLNPRDTLRLEKLRKSLESETTFEIPNSMHAWVTGVKNDSLGEDPVGILKESIHKWSLDDLLANSKQCNEIANFIVNADKPQEEIYKAAFISLVDFFASNEKSSQRNFSPIYASLIKVLAWRGTLTPDELEIAATLTNALLNSAPTCEVYLDLLSDMGDILEKNKFVLNTDWMLNIAELFILHPSQDNDDLRLNLFIIIINHFLSIVHRISEPQKDVLKTLAQDFNCPDLLSSFPTEKDDEDSEVLRQDYSGYIGIYTLTDGASQRASAVLKKYYPQSRIEVNNDHEATERLKSLAKNSDIFVFAWKSGKHQAYFCIKEIRAQNEILMASGKGSASIIKCVMDKVQSS